MAKKTNVFNWYHPNYLYRSDPNKILADSYAKIVKDRFPIIGSGLHPVELWPDVEDFRWTEKHCALLFKSKGTERKLYLKYYSFFDDYGFQIDLWQGDKKLRTDRHLSKKGWQCLILDTVPGFEDDVRVELTVDESWVPKALGINDDPRELGIAIKEIGLI